jgi:hypothetical protein
MADREDPRPLAGDPIASCGVGNPARRVLQREDLAHRAPRMRAHGDGDRRPEQPNERREMRRGAAIDPARQDRAAHPPFLEAQDRVRRENRCFRIGFRRLFRPDPGGREQPVQIVIRRVAGLVAPAMAHEIIDVAEILTDDQKPRVAMPQPLLPMADDIGVEVEFGAAPDPAGTALDTEPARLPRRDERAPFLLHVLPHSAARDYRL